ncbi:RNA-binding motif protein, X-linked 2-like [Ochotona curzoniae]|uniref:RNA-binding motif protein, X-linked 2-like n=1 Tax=Ochotona curzoniae TaxID=130825 RepID=UPI001B349634|nr:RNA-binding motif protein, X-linked 2-like [Ochotona curzoniae]
MNSLTKVKLVRELSEREAGTTSWHSMYQGSAWVFLGGLPYALTEGDIVCVFSQYGEIVNIHLVRDKRTGKSKGFGFLCYEDQRSTVLAVDNFNGIKIKGRTIRVDHVSHYRPPRGSEGVDNSSQEGCAPQDRWPGSWGGCRSAPRPPQPTLGNWRGDYASAKEEAIAGVKEMQGQAMRRPRPDCQKERRPRTQ